MRQLIFGFLVLCLSMVNVFGASTGTTAGATATSKASATTAGGDDQPPAPGAKKNKDGRWTFSCQNCMGKGVDCKGAALSGCLYCMKLVGKVQDDPKNLAIQLFVKAMAGGAKANQYKGQEVCVRKCITQVDLDSNGYPDNTGCGPFADFGLAGNGCVCEGECKEPNTSVVSSTQAPSSTKSQVSSKSPSTKKH